MKRWWFLETGTSEWNSQATNTHETNRLSFLQEGRLLVDTDDLMVGEFMDGYWIEVRTEKRPANPQP